MKDKIKNYSFVFIIIILILFSGSQYLGKLKSLSTLKKYKSVLVERDSVRKISDTHYQKLINDTNSIKDLNILLKNKNKQLYNKLNKANKKIMSITKLDLKPVSKIDSSKIIIKKELGKEKIIFNSFYPDKTDYFVKHSGVIVDSLLNDKWVFNNLTIDVVVTEKEKGLFEVDLTAPKWLSVKDIQVNSLPLSLIKKDRFDWMLGSSIGLGFNNLVPVVELEGGFRLNKSIYSIQGNTNKEFKISYKLLF